LPTSEVHINIADKTTAGVYIVERGHGDHISLLCRRRCLIPLLRQ